MDLYVWKWNIASGTGLSRDTVCKYLAVAVEAGVTWEVSVPTGDKINLLVGIGQSGPRQIRVTSKEALTPWGDQVYQRRFLPRGEFYHHFL